MTDCGCRIWVNWLRGYKEWVPGSRAIAAAAALDAALSAGHSAEEAVAASESAAKALGGAVVFITASATLMEQVRAGALCRLIGQAGGMVLTGCQE
jgi:hypothetical protein